MRYPGSKRRIAKDILPIILEGRQEGQWYVEPFVGGCNIIDKVDGLRIGADNNFYLIAMWKALQTGWLPPETVTNAEWRAIRDNPYYYPPELVGFVGSGVSFAGKWFGGFSRWKNVDYAAQQRRTVLRQLPFIQDVVFHACSYEELELPPNSIIYCDPPYSKTTSGYMTTKFDHAAFWDWCEDKTKEGHSVFVSEFVAPETWASVWNKEIHSSLDKGLNNKYETEHLWRYYD